ncbi:MAG: T9SS type A sorting domain-containing protein [Flavobacteriales bacterium]|nr:T9SS type A sorting domain-containing protein [Flavobacteriales bacterium]
MDNADGWHIGYSSGSGSDLEVNMSRSMSAGGVYDQVPITNGVWYHVAMVFFGPGTTEIERLKMYLNGVEVPLDYYSPMPDFTSTAVYPLQIGNNYGFASVGQWNGKIDDVGIWTTALTEQQIVDLYTAQDLNVGIAEQDRHAFRIAPNPAADVVHLTGDPSYSGSVDILNTLGELLSSVPYNRHIDVAGLPEGIYLLRVEGPDGPEVLRFVKA